MTGRKTICTPEVTKTICDKITLGLSNRDAAALAGISEPTFYGWLQRGSKEAARLAESPRRRVLKRERPFLEFIESIERAKPRRIEVLVGRIQQAAQGSGDYTETKTIRKEGEPTQTTIVTKQRHAEWTASAWLLERLHPDEFGRRQRLDVYDWRTEVIEMLQAGAITPQDVYEQLGHEYATDVLKSAGVVIAEDGQLAEPGDKENNTDEDKLA